MAITGRTSRRSEFERGLERFNPAKIALIRALPYNCPNEFQDGQDSISLTCSLCNGTGYVGMARGGSLNAPPAAQVFYIFGDIQLGHGLNGIGGDSVRVLQDLGKQDLGEAILFCKVDNFDNRTGQNVHPEVEGDLVRPDRVIASDGYIYNVDRQIIGSFGSETVYRQYSLQRGTQGTT